MHIILRIRPHRIDEGNIRRQSVGTFLWNLSSAVPATFKETEKSATLGDLREASMHHENPPIDHGGEGQSCEDCHEALICLRSHGIVFVAVSSKIITRCIIIVRIVRRLVRWWSTLWMLLLTILFHDLVVEAAAVW